MLRIPKLSRLHASGTVTLPVSKSLANRELVLQALFSQLVPSLPDNISNDVKLLHKALSETSDSIDFEDAGTPLRLYLAYAACTGVKDIWIKGSKRLTQRPIEPLLKALENLGAVFEFGAMPYQLPLRIAKALDLSCTSVEIEAGISSQFISALLLIAAKFDRGLEIRYRGEIRSEPYIVMTLDCLRKRGIQVTYSTSSWKVEPVKLDFLNISPDSVFEGDWSSASFIYGMAALAESCDILLTNLNMDSSQGDKVCAEIFKRLGVETVPVSEGIRLKKTPDAESNFDMDFRHFPDLFPPVLMVAVLKGKKGRMSGISSLRDKESDRVEAMRSNLQPLGVQFEIGQDDLEYDGSDLIRSEEVIDLDSFSDHRIAMACSLLAFRFMVSIRQPETVLKSFPGYWEIFRKLCGVVS